jgi:photosystem II reaction center protein Psb28
MKVRIQFLENLNEEKIPIIRLTKSQNKKTGTATFLFVYPLVFSNIILENDSIMEMSLFWDNKKITTTDVSILFKKGKPFILKSVFLFKNSGEWFNFLNFMQIYSKEKGLSFSFLPMSINK